MERKKSVKYHFTYKENPSGEHLCQGDILTKTDQLNGVLKKYFSHYVKSEYTHFIVLTQSCDLVKRGSENKCNSRYITLAAVRSLYTATNRIIEHIAEKRFFHNDKIFCNSKHKDSLKSKVASLINNQDKDYFFLKSSPIHGLYEDSCAFLHLSIAIKIEHYDCCLSSKILELKDNFQSRLGWMVGNIYSRVGTEDYVPAAVPDKASFMKFIDEILERNIVWVPASSYSRFKAGIPAGLSKEQISEDVATENESKYENQINSLSALIKSKTGLTGDQTSKLKEFLNSKSGRKFLRDPTT